MEDIKLPKIGQKVYWIQTMFEHKLVQSVITGIVLSSDNNVLINIDHSVLRSEFEFCRFDRNRFWFSEKKANNVLNCKKLQSKRKDERYKKETALYEKAKAQKNEVFINYKSKPVLVKLGDKDRGVYWAQDTIKDIYPHSSGTYYFYSQKNVYLLTKENKTWKFYTEKIKLEMEKEKLEKQLREIEEKLKGEQL